MAKITIGGVKKGPDAFTILIILTEPQEIEGQPGEVPIGEAVITIPLDMEMADIRGRIVDTAKEVLKAHKDAKDKRKDVEELELPEIT